MSIRTQNRPLPIGLGHLVPGPRVEPVWCVLVVNNNINPVGAVVIVDETVNLLSRKVAKSQRAQSKLAFAQIVNAVTNRVAATQIGDITFVALRETRTRLGNVWKREVPQNRQNQGNNT